MMNTKNIQNGKKCNRSIAINLRRKLPFGLEESGILRLSWTDVLIALKRV